MMLIAYENNEVIVTESTVTAEYYRKSLQNVYAQKFAATIQS
jgi:hypothetical protein